MGTHDLPQKGGKPEGIIDYKIDFRTSPPGIAGHKTDQVESFVDLTENTIKYKTISEEEGCLNIYVTRFNNGQCTMHVFGLIHGERFKTQKNISTYSTKDFDMLNNRIKVVLEKSRNILRTYYRDANVKAIEGHLMAFVHLF